MIRSLLPGRKKGVTNVCGVMKTDGDHKRKQEEEKRRVSAAVVPPATARCHSKTRENLLLSFLHKSLKNKNNTFF